MNTLLSTTSLCLAATLTTNPCASASFGSTAEHQFVQPLLQGAPLPGSLDRFELGSFFEHEVEHLEAVAVSAGSAYYFHPIGHWNGSQLIHSDAVDLAVMEDVGSAGSDAIALLTSTGLEVRAVGASGQFEVLGSLSTWAGVDRVWAVTIGAGIIELHG